MFFHLRRGMTRVEDKGMLASKANVLTEAGSLVDTGTAGIEAGDKGANTLGATSEFSSTPTSVVSALVEGGCLLLLLLLLSSEEEEDDSILCCFWCSILNSCRVFLFLTSLVSSSLTSSTGRTSYVFGLGSTRIVEEEGFPSSSLTGVYFTLTFAKVIGARQDMEFRCPWRNHTSEYSSPTCL